MVRTLVKNTGRVAVAREMLCVMYHLLMKGEKFTDKEQQNKEQQNKKQKKTTREPIGSCLSPH